MDFASILAALTDYGVPLQGDIAKSIKALPVEQRNLAKKVSDMREMLEKKNHALDTVSGSLHSMTLDFQISISTLSVFTRLADLLNTNTNIAEIPKLVVEIFIEGFDFDQCSIMLYEEKSGLLRLAAGAGQGDYFGIRDMQQAMRTDLCLKLGEGAAGAAARDKAPLIINDIAADTVFLKNGRLSRGSLACLPMLYQGKLVGVLNFSYPETGFFVEHLIRALRPMANSIGQIIELARIHRDMEGVNLSLEEVVREKTSELEKANKKLVAANRLKDEFLANVSHELRTPLTSIIGFSRLMIDFRNMDEDERQSYLKIINERGQGLESLLNDLFDLSQLESENLPMNIERFNMGELIKQSVEHYRLMAESGGLKIAGHVDARPLMLHADRKKIKRVLDNLIHNAVKYTTEGGRIEVLGKQLEREILVSVSDTGVGIDKKEHGVIFERFRQVENQKIKAGGTGIGLSLAKLIIELHGGKIWVESELGRGTTFSFCIPTELFCSMSEHGKIEPLIP